MGRRCGISDSRDNPPWVLCNAKNGWAHSSESLSEKSWLAQIKARNWHYIVQNGRRTSAELFFMVKSFRKTSNTSGEKKMGKFPIWEEHVPLMMTLCHPSLTSHSLRCFKIVPKLKRELDITQLATFTFIGIKLSVPILTAIALYCIMCSNCSQSCQDIVSMSRRDT